MRKDEGIGLSRAVAQLIGGKAGAMFEFGQAPGLGRRARLFLDAEQVLVANEDIVGPVEHIARDLFPRGVVQVD